MLADFGARGYFPPSTVRIDQVPEDVESQQATVHPHAWAPMRIVFSEIKVSENAAQGLLRSVKDKISTHPSCGHELRR